MAFAACVYGNRVGATPGDENVGMARVYAHFGEWESARAIYRRELASASTPGRASGNGPRLNPFWLREMLAAVELESGRLGEALALYRESVTRRREGVRPGSMGAHSPFVVNRLAVAEALAGDPVAARALLDGVIEDARYPEFLTSRAALRADAGDASGAERDLSEALGIEPELAAALESRAWLRGDRAAVAAARRAAARAPRSYPYGVGDGRGLNTQLPMLVWRDGVLALYRPVRARP
jgi:tetratricopeptide (TPR) repeat protein